MLRFAFENALVADGFTAPSKCFPLTSPDLVLADALFAEPEVPTIVHQRGAAP
jgi:hypothetical protein